MNKKTRLSTQMFVTIYRFQGTNHLLENNSLPLILHMSVIRKEKHYHVVGVMG